MWDLHLPNILITNNKCKWTKISNSSKVRFVANFTKFPGWVFQIQTSSFCNWRTSCAILHVKIYTSSSLKQSFYLVKWKDVLNMKQNDTLPGATMISCFFDLILRKVRSFWGSMSRTVLLAFTVSWWRRPAYWTVVELSNVVRIGMPVTRFTFGLTFFRL